MTSDARRAVAVLVAPPERTWAQLGVGNCGRMFPLSARLPWWTKGAKPPAGFPWVMPRPRNIVGVIIGQPLRIAPRDDGRTNKIRWISRVPRNGADLIIRATRRSDGRTATVTLPAESGPGEIYPSIVDLPGTGCWQVDLAWGPNTGRVYLYYAS